MAFDLVSGSVVRVEQLVIPDFRVPPPQTRTTLVVPTSGPAGPRGRDGVDGTSSGTTRVAFNARATVALSGHRVVTRDPAGGLVYAGSDNLAHLHTPLWLTTAAAAADDQVEVVALGYIDETSWSWTPGPVYLAADGVLTQVPPTAPAALFLAQVGVATNPTSLFVERRPSITLI